MKYNKKNYAITIAKPFNLSVNFIIFSKIVNELSNNNDYIIIFIY